MDNDTAGSIHEDELDTNLPGDDEFDAVEAFLKDANPEQDETEKSPSETDDGDTATAGDEEAPAQETEDDPEFDIPVGEETRKAKLSELKRLYGQEASLTQKSQVVAQLRAQAEASATQATTALTRLVEKADKEWEPYSKLDFMTLSVKMDPDDFAALRQEAQAAWSNKQFFAAELGEIEKANAERQAVTHRERAAATIKELSDPETGIKGWGPEMYGELMDYATSQGMPAQAARSVTEASSLRLMHKAMLYDRAQAAAKKAVKAAPAKPTVVLKTGQAGEKAAPKAAEFKDTIAKMRRSGGGLDATADAFFAMSRRDSE